MWLNGYGYIAVATLLRPRCYGCKAMVVLLWRWLTHCGSLLWLCCFGSVVNRGHHAAAVPLAL